MTDTRTFLADVKSSPNDFYIIHYSSEHLFDTDIGGMTPRITSVCILHMGTGQTQSFAVHIAADNLNVPRDQVQSNYDSIEAEMLREMYGFMGTRLQNYWVHWNMRSSVFGFEHLAHRYQVLCGQTAPNVPIAHRINLNDVLRKKYGPDYAPHPQMMNLMRQQGELPKHFLTGEQESQCFANGEYIRMHLSTISKVHFFSYIIRQANKGKLKTVSQSFVSRIDRLLENRFARFAAFVGTCLGLLSWAAWVFHFLPI